MTNPQDMQEFIRALCEKALEGALKLSQFHDLWPTEANVNPFFHKIYEDMEDGIEHTSGFFLRSGVNCKAWHASSMYRVLYLDFLLLSANREADELLRCRQFVLEQNLFSKNHIEEEVRRYFGG